MACLEKLKGPLNSINQVVFVINQIIDAICGVLSPILNGTPDTLLGFDTNGDLVEVSEGTGINISGDIISVDMSDFDTDDLAEGPGNLYYTNERVDDEVAALIQDGIGISWMYDDGFGTLIGDVSLDPFDTDDLAEGDVNLYYTDDIVDTHLNRDSASDDIFFSTSALTPQLILTLNYEVLEIADHRIGLTIAWRTTGGGNRPALFGISFDGSPIADAEIKVGSTDSSTRDVLTTFVTLAASSTGVKTIELFAWVDNAAQTVECYRRELAVELWKP